MPACPRLVSVSSRTQERTRDSGGALQPLKPSAQFWVIAQIRRLLKIPASDTDNRTVFACSSSRNRLSENNDTSMPREKRKVL
jgi:hypothetical protein